MNKPQSLRDALSAALEAKHRLSERPGDFHMKVVDLRPEVTGRPGQGFAYRYTLALGFLDFAGSSSEIVVPLLRWIQRWQHDLLVRAEPFTMEVDFLSDSLVDVLIRLELTETVRYVTREDGGVDLIFENDPLPMALQDGPPLHAVYLNGELIAHCTAHPAA